MYIWETMSGYGPHYSFYFLSLFPSNLHHLPSKFSYMFLLLFIQQLCPIFLLATFTTCFILCVPFFNFTASSLNIQLFCFFLLFRFRRRIKFQGFILSHKVSYFVDIKLFVKSPGLFFLSFYTYWPLLKRPIF